MTKKYLGAFLSISVLFSVLSHAENVRSRVVHFTGSTVIPIPAIGEMGEAWMATPVDLPKSGAFTCMITISNPGNETQEIVDFSFNGILWSSMPGASSRKRTKEMKPEKIVVLSTDSDPKVCKGSELSNCKKIPKKGTYIAMIRLATPMTGLGHTVIAPCTGTFQVSNETGESGKVIDPNKVGTLMATGSISYASDTTTMLLGGTGRIVHNGHKQSYQLQDLQAPIRGYTTGTTTFEINGGRPF